MKQYGMVVKSFHIESESVVVSLTVHDSFAPLIPLINLNIDIQRNESTSLNEYESIALNKAASIIQGIAEEITATA
ncbi:hypothetical protein ACY2PK_001093 [Klebsiella aerogenes]|uniref:hypothetical protein n=1 Tax=Klebsiella aerogenes TaxID=548 RepID=UPI0005EE78A8|nr:hypothetical protein [Klebsiella aerogenes]EMF0788813.1 hypothetical protein [Klebsiella aerogenes]KJL90114.1 hypothetical protein SS11_02465 [Klebsiella aerogenes]